MDPYTDRVLTDLFEKTAEVEREEAVDTVVDYLCNNYDKQHILEILRVAIRQQITQYRRLGAHKIERENWGAVKRRRPVANGGNVVDPLAARKQLLSKRFFANHDIGYVAWGEATVPEHAARIVYLQGHIDGIQRTANRHREAIGLIELKQVKCLQEIDGVEDMIEIPAEDE